MTKKTDFWRRLYKWIGLPQKYAPIYVEDVPEPLEPNKIYLVGEEKIPWSASFLCPCGCQATISLSLIANDDPSWKVANNRDGTISLHPSVWRTKGCRSHFFVWNNQIVWAKTKRSTWLHKSR